MKKKVFFAAVTVLVSVLSACGKGGYPEFPDNAIAFEMGTFEDVEHDSAAFGTLEYDGRTYIGYGTINNKFTNTDADQCIGYVVMDANSTSNPDADDTNTRIYTLAGDADHNFLIEYSDAAEPPVRCGVSHQSGQV